MNNIGLKLLRRTYLLGLGLSVAAAAWIPLYLAKTNIESRHKLPNTDRPAKIDRNKAPEVAGPTETDQNSNPLLIAIIDTGIDVDHPDLQGVLWNSNGEGDKDDRGALHGWNFADSSPDLTDKNGHGTHIAGIIQRELKIYSQLLPLRPIQFMVLKYYRENATGSDNLKNSNAALAYAIENGADIINYSGGGRDPSETERELMEVALQRGIYIVAAAGNEGRNADLEPFYPASYKLPNIIAVANLAKNGSLHPTSNYGAASIDIAAPGDEILSSFPGSREATMTGTSQATAQVTAALAAFLASRPQKLVPEVLKERLYQTGHILPTLLHRLGSGAGLDAESLILAREAGMTAQNLVQINTVSLGDLFFDDEAELQLRLVDAERVSVSN